MATRSIASLSLTFGLVSIPVKLYSATESAAAIKFKLMAPGGVRVRQQYVAEEPAASAESRATAPEDAPVAPVAPAVRAARSAADRVVDFPKARPNAREPEPASLPEPQPRPAEPVHAVVERSDMVKGYEFEKGRFVLFTAAELEALEEGSRHTIDIVSFIPANAVDPIYYDKAYFLAPDKRGDKPYSLLRRAMRDTGRCALAKWAWRSKEFVVEIRPAERGLVLQQLLYADEVRSIADLGFDLAPVGEGELKLAKQLIEQISADAYDPTQFVDEEKQRILAAVEKKIHGKQIVAPANPEPAAAGNVVDLMEALRASLAAPARAGSGKKAAPATVLNLGERKSAKRAGPTHDARKPEKTKSRK